MIRIKSVTLREVILPLVEPFRTAKGIAEKRRIILLEMVNHTGEISWSECVAGAAPGYSAETVDSAWDILLERILPAVMGRELANPKKADAWLARIAREHPMARAAVEMGTWALAASHEGRALASVLAQASASKSKPRNSVEAGIVIGMTSSADAVLKQVGNAVASGYRRVKLKISLASNIRSLRTIRDAVGERLAVDANGTFEFDNATHMRKLSQLDGLDMALIEQPLAPEAMREHGELQKMLSTPLCLDESISTAASVDAMATHKSGRIVNLKAGRVGGFTQAIAIHDRCARAGIPVLCGGMLESGVGRAYNVALASLPNFTLPGDISPSARYWRRDVIRSPWTMSANGFLDVPLDQSGIGVEIDDAFVQEQTVRRVVMK